MAGFTNHRQVEGMNSMGESAASKLMQVRQMFEAPARYLGQSGFNIRIRQETARELVAGRRFDRILDIGCGNGTISLPLLRPDNRLTLLDVSSKMISIARANVPPDLAENVEILNADVMAAPLEQHAYDLIVCMGVLAHVDSPEATLGRIASLLRPGGSLILEFTDAFHPAGRPTVVYHRLLDTFRPARYSLNLLSRRRVVGVLQRNNLRLVSAYRYGLWFPMVHRVFSQNTLYKIVRAIFGTGLESRNARLGNQYICLVKS